MPTNFFDLPAEIRDRIYYEALVPAEGIRPTVHIPPAESTFAVPAHAKSRSPTAAQHSTRIFGDRTVYPEGSGPVANDWKQQPKQPRPSLLLSHPQIYREAKQLYLRRSTFIFELDYDDIVAGLPAITAWFRSLSPEDLRQVGSIVMYYRDMFTVEIGHAVVNGRLTLVLQHLYQDSTHRDWDTTYTSKPLLGTETYLMNGIPYDDRHVVASLEEALQATLDQSEEGSSGIPESWNLLTGIAQFLLNLAASHHWAFNKEWHSALHFVKGEAYIYTTVEWFYNYHPMPHPHNPSGGRDQLSR